VERHKANIANRTSTGQMGTDQVQPAGLPDERR